MKIGELVKSYVPVILEYCWREDRPEFDRLMSKDYSKLKFGINYPFLTPVESGILVTDTKRYWIKEYVLDGRRFRVCSQWIIDHKYRFLDYLKDLKLIDNSTFNHLDAQLVTKSKVAISGKSVEIKSLNQDTLEMEAETMSLHYKRFYIVERSIRVLIEEVMDSAYGSDWWGYIDEKVQKNVNNHLNYELDTTHTKRSERKIDYTTFGDLRKIINNHWSIFEPKFKRKINSVNEVLIDLNRIRVSIAHCSLLATKEAKRLDIRIDDWNDLLRK